jgi:hypothetical protein
MTLVSPGVEVDIIDQSQYLPGAPASVPLVVFATAQDKVNPNAVGIAPGTTAANAGKLFQVTSQRDLVSLYGTPTFYTTSDGTPIQGYELNEYGLLAAYSALNVTNQLYCLRADIDLASLVAKTGRPTGAPADGTWWYDATSTSFGIYEWDATNQVFSNMIPAIVVTDSSQLLGGSPIASIGNIGDYAVVMVPTYDPPAVNTTSDDNATYWYKDSTNTWVALGDSAWLLDVPAVTGVAHTGTLSTLGTFVIALNGLTAAETVSATITVSSGNTVTNVATQINNLNWYGVRAGVYANSLVIYIDENINQNGITLSGTANVLNELFGISVSTTYYAPITYFGTAAQAPLWGEGQNKPRPTGSVWIKVGAAGSGFTPVMKQYDSAAGVWVTKNVGLYTNDASAIYSLDPTGGQAIPANTVYAQYGFNGQNNYGPVYFWERVATGPTVVTGTVTVDDPQTDQTFTSGGNLYVHVTNPNSSGWSDAYTVTLAADATFVDFLVAWQAAGIPNTSVTVTTDNALQISHASGGSIRISDINPTTGLSNGILGQAGFVAEVTTGCKTGYFVISQFNAVAVTSTSGSGLNCTLTVATGDSTSGGAPQYIVKTITNGGTGYAIGDTITISHSSLGGLTSENDLIYVVTNVNTGAITALTRRIDCGVPHSTFDVELSNFVSYTYVPNEGAPSLVPNDYTNWFYAVTDQVDIMVNTSSGWKGYLNTNFNTNGFPTPGSPNYATDPNGPIISASEPTTQSDGTSLVYGDLWINTSDLENYPLINRWQKLTSTQDGWVLIDNTDQVSSNGVLFADARWSSDQDTINPANDPIPSIKTLLKSNNLDLDAPESSNYPVGMLLWNTRRSGNNIKQWRNNYFTATNFPDQTIPDITSTWVSASGHNLAGVAYMGRLAQRNMVVESLKSVIDTNTDIRDEDNFFNLICTPNYCEVQQNMVLLNIARGETAYILGDTPMRLLPQATDIVAWSNSQAADGGPFRDTYLGLFYPSGLSNDLSGNTVAVPPSHMMLFTFLRNDQLAYPWFAAAGTRRGIIENATGIGYIDPTTGEFVTMKTNLGLRDVLYTNFINPLVFFTGNGLLNYGNKTSYNSQSALDRTNVARLVAYIRRQLTIAARPFVFEPNDAITRQQISGVVESLLVDLVAKRGVYDYLVVCDESNNTPTRIDRNELWVDVAIEPVKAAEFIYIPVRILNTGALSTNG